MKPFLEKLIVVVVIIAGLPSFCAGTLSTSGEPLRIMSHTVDIVLNNGFARTEVTQRFHNANTETVEGIYAFPLPESAALSSVTVLMSEKVLNGEVLAKEKAETIYKEEKESGNEAGLAGKDGYREFRFNIANIPSGDVVTVTFTYYQSLKVESGICRYQYPLEEGGTEEGASFWTRNDRVEGDVEIRVKLKSAWPVADVRVPVHSQDAQTVQKSEGEYETNVRLSNASLNEDFVYYYRLEEDLPGRIEVIPYKNMEEGTFMMVVTPGTDLAPLSETGSDYTFLLDVSGSMSSKLHTLAEGVAKAIERLQPRDRFRIVTFSNRAEDITGGWIHATQENVHVWVKRTGEIQPQGGTNLYAGLKKALSGLEQDRTSSLFIVTDGVTNTGRIEPKDFFDLMKTTDVRLFGFLMGNNANWPLMRTICDTAGGYYTGVSNSDDIIGQIMLAKSKVVHECMHDVDLKISGSRIHDVTDGYVGKVFRGEQLVLFGRYSKGGNVKVSMKARISGQEKLYQTTIALPDLDTDHPELERLWALKTVEQAEQLRDIGLIPDDECAVVLRDIGVDYQIVTDETSMIVLDDAAFSRRGIERRNQDRIEREKQAQSRRATRAAVNYRSDSKRPAFPGRAPGVGGGGAIDPFSAILMLLVGAFAANSVIKN